MVFDNDIECQRRVKVHIMYFSFTFTFINYFQSAATVNDRNNVRVEAQPVDTHSNMSPETLTAISGSSSPQPPTSSATASDHDQKNMMQNLFQDGKH